MGSGRSKPTLPEDFETLAYERLGCRALPLDPYPGRRLSNGQIVEWWSSLQLVHPGVPYEIVLGRRALYESELITPNPHRSHYATSTRFGTLSPLTRLLVGMVISDMKRDPRRLDATRWLTGWNATVWVMPGRRTVRIEYLPRDRKFIALYTYVHLSEDLRFERYEYHAKLK